MVWGIRLEIKTPYIFTQNCLEVKTGNTLPGDYDQQLKLKEIGRALNLGWIMLFNWITRQKPYLLLIAKKFTKF